MSGTCSHHPLLTSPIKGEGSKGNPVASDSMRITKLGEFGLIDKIRKASFRSSPDVLVGIGDDAAVLKQTPSEALLATTDMLIEGVHFDLACTDFYSLGWKCVAVNLSDIAAMGGRPCFCLTSLGIPLTITVEQITEFYRGCNSVLRKYKTALVGGDTCSSLRGFIISITLLGESEHKRPLTRSGAKPGDRIFVTGPLGDSAAGFELLQTGSRLKSPEAKKLIEKHLRPVPRVHCGRKIAQTASAHAMIDISDGLSSDLLHVCEQSKVGALVEADAIPLSSQLKKASGYLKKIPLHYALNGGEDYELLFTAPVSKIAKLRSLGFPIHEIGEITRNRAGLIIDGQGNKRALKPGGYNHFRKS